MNNDKCSDYGKDIEVLADVFEEEQKMLKELDNQSEIDAFLDRCEKEEERMFRERFQPWHGVSINGKKLLFDLQTGDICDKNGNPLNSCDSLAVIDGCLDEEN